MCMVFLKKVKYVARKENNTTANIFIEITIGHVVVQV